MSLNVYMVGSPHSGKTTAAAKVFAYLKETGLSVEFVPEQARYHIASKRFILGLRPDQEVQLTDEDQIKILKAQSTAEYTLFKVCDPKTIVVADSWSLMALLYMSDGSPGYTFGSWVTDLSHIQEIISSKQALVFYLPPVPYSETEVDTIRAHNEYQALEVDKKIPALLQDWGMGVEMIRCDGTPDERAELIINIIRRRVAENG